MKLDRVSLVPGARMRGILAAAAWVLVQPVAHGQTWTGAASQWWNDPANWKGGLPVSGPATTLSFEGGTQLESNNNLADPFTLQALVFGSTAGSFQLSGAPLDFAANGQLLQHGENAQELASKVMVSSDLLVGGTGGGVVAFTGGLEGAGNIVKTGASELWLEGSGAAYTGTVKVDAGRVVVAHASALEKSTAQLNVANGLSFATGNATLGGLSGAGRFDFGSANIAVGANHESTTYSGPISNGGAATFRKVGTGTLTLTGTSTYVGATVVHDGTLLVEGGGQIGNEAQPVLVGGNLMNFGTGALMVDGAGSRVTASSFNVDFFGSITVRNGGILAGPAGERPALVMEGGAFTGYGEFDLTLVDGAVIAATAPLTLHMQSEVLRGELSVLGTTLTIHAPGSQLLEAVTGLDSTNGLATIDAPNGLTLAPAGRLGGRGVIRGPFTDQTGGAGIAVAPRDLLVLTNPDFGADEWTFVNYVPKADHVTIDGGQVDTLGEPFAFGTSITGRGTIVAPVTNLLVGGISNGGPSTITLTGDLTVGSTAPRFLPGNRFLQTTFQIGAHRFSAVGRTWIEDSTMELAGGTFFAPETLEEDVATTSISGFGVLVTKPTSEITGTTQPVATGALGAVNDWVIPGNQLVQLISTAPVSVSNIQVQGGQVVAKAGFELNGPTGISGYGMVDGPTSGTLSESLVATAPLPVYTGIIRSSEAHVLSTAPTIWNSALDTVVASVPTVPASGTTVHAPAGLILAAPGGGGPVTIQAPSVSFAGVSRVSFASTTIHGAVDFGASEILALPNLTVTGPTTMNGAVLHQVTGWSLATPLTGNGFVYGEIPPGVTFAPQGSAPAGQDFRFVPGDLLVVSETPYTITGEHALRGWYRGTNGLVFEGVLHFPADARAEGIFRGDRVRILPDGVGSPDGTLPIVTIGQEAVPDAVHISDLNASFADITFQSATPIVLGTGVFQTLATVHSETELHLGILQLMGSLGRGVTMNAVTKGEALSAFTLNGIAAHSLISLDFVDAGTADTQFTLAGFADGAPALLPRNGVYWRGRFTALQGMLLREGSKMDVSDMTFHGKLILDGRIWSSGGAGPDLYGTLTGNGVLDVSARLVGADARINPGEIGATGMLTVKDLSVIPDPLNVAAGIGDWVFELGPNDYDRLTVTGNLTLGGALTVALLDGFTVRPGLSFPIMDVQGTLSGTFAGLGEGATVGNFGGWDLHVSYAGGNGNDVVLYTVPEPGVPVYLVALGVALLGTRRRSRGK